MNKLIILDKLDLNNKNLIEEINGGHSGALTYKLKLNSTNYFLKVFNGKIHSGIIQTIETICHVYKALNILSLDFLGYGNTSQDNKHFLIYNFIEGKTLKEVSDKWSFENIYKIGNKIGKDFKKLKNGDLNAYDNIYSEDIDSIVKYVNNIYHTLLNDNAMLNLMSEYFAIEKLERLMVNFNNYQNYFNNLSFNLIHGDIKRSNFMYIQEEYCVIDIESLKYSYDVFNFRYQIIRALCQDEPKETIFVKAYFDGLYDHTRPTYFNEQIMFVIMLNFVEHVSKVYHNKERLKRCFKRMNQIFELLDNLDKNII